MALWFGTQATVKTASALDSIAPDTTLDSQVNGQPNVVEWNGEVREITVGGGDMDVDALNVFGDQLKDESRPSLKTVELTMSFEDIDILEEVLDTAVQVGTTEYYRINGADKTGSRLDRLVLFKLDDGTNVVNILLNHSYFDTTGEVSLAADGNAEITISAACLIKDFHTEDNIG